MDTRIPIDGVELAAELIVPADPRGVVVFVHGSGSDRRSLRDQHLAAALRAHGLATLLFDLLTPDEAQQDANDAELRLDAGFLADRLIGVTDWVRARPSLAPLPIAYLGASTGAAVALIAAARRPMDIAALVGRSGRPDLAAGWLDKVHASVLLVVGADDPHVLALNRAAQTEIAGPNDLVIVPGAGHRFEEPGALDALARVAGPWLVAHLPPAPARRELGDAVC